jgi:UDP-glucose 4-epimerase
MAKKYKKVLVTGGAGFIGSHVVDAYIRRRAKVYVIDDLSGGKLVNVNPNATFYKLSILSPKFIDRVKRIKPDLVIHTAAQQDVRASVVDPAYDAKVNILGTLNVIEACRLSGVKKIVFTSSGGAIYPVDKKPPYSEKITPKPICPYGIAKYASEHYLHFAYEVHGISYTILRLSNVYGPRQDCSSVGGVMAIFTDRMLKNKPVIINGSGRQTRDYVFVGDVVRAITFSANRSFVGVVNIGTGKEVSVNQVFRTLKKATDSDMPERHGPGKAGEVARSSLDARLAYRKIGWKSNMSFEEGIKKTIAWFKKHPTHAKGK